VRNEYEIVVVKCKRKRYLGIPRHRWKDDIRMDYGNRVEKCGLDACGLG